MFIVFGMIVGKKKKKKLQYLLSEEFVTILNLIIIMDGLGNFLRVKNTHFEVFQIHFFIGIMKTIIGNWNLILIPQSMPYVTKQLDHILLVRLAKEIE